MSTGLQPSGVQTTRLIGRLISDPRERLVARVAANMFHEPNFYADADRRRGYLLHDLNTIIPNHPEFIVQLAYYAREKLNIRSTANFLLAYAASKPETKRLLEKYFNATVRLPNDLLEVVQFLQQLSTKPRPEGGYYVPTCLQRFVRHKFREFNVYQLGKYCSDGRRKHMAEKKDKGKSKLKIDLAMKRLIRLCHICEPPDLVCAILGKRYPGDEEEFNNSSFAEAGLVFDPSQASKRMRLPVPETWETQLSAQGNGAGVWEYLVKEKKLPFMAMIRNLRNILQAGVDRETHNLVLARLQDAEQVAASRLFPFRFFSAFEALAFAPQAPRNNARHPPRASPPPQLLQEYHNALESAIKLAIISNMQPIIGHSVIFCDVSGSMDAGISGGPLGSVRTCMEVGVLLGLMLRYVCESSEFIVFSSPGAHSKCWFTVDLSRDCIKDDILKSMRSVLQQGQQNLGGGTDFPYDFIQKITAERRHIDQIFMFSDMMVSPGYEEFAGTGTGGSLTVGKVLNTYRRKVNEHLRFVTIDLACQAQDLIGADFADDYRNVQMWGYSDAVLGLVSELQKPQVQAVEEFAAALLNK